MNEPNVESTMLMGQALLYQGYVNDQQLALILSNHSKSSQRLGEAAVSHGFLTDQTLAQFLASFFSIEYFVQLVPI